jgi:Pvc16 N-terminal domain
MIHEVDEALRRLVREEALRGSDIDVVFDAPTKDWAARRNAPTVNLYLYDLREDLRRRQRGLINEYDPTGTRVVARHQPPRHIKLSYLLTAWTQRAEDEHRLLSSLLTTFLRYEAVPPTLLGGRLAELGLPVPLTVALPPPEDRSFADVWSALGGELKPSLDIVVSAPVDAGAVRPAGPPAEAGLEVALSGDEPVHHEVGGGEISTRRGAW